MSQVADAMISDDQLMAPVTATEQAAETPETLADENKVALGQMGDLDNLFGDDEESKDANDNTKDVEEQLSPEQHGVVVPPLDGQGVDASTPEEDEGYEEQRMIEVSIPYTLQPLSTESDLYYVRMPNFLSIEPKQFDVDEYMRDALADNDVSDLSRNDRIKLRSEHTIRWRFHEGKKQSNAKLVRWEDESLSLLLGGEMFDISKKPMGQEFSYLASSLPAQGLLAVRRAFTHSLSFTPTSTSSFTHKRLTEAIARRQVKSRGVQSVETLQDPEKLKREAEKLEESRLKSKRKLESQRRVANARYENSVGLTAHGLEADDEIFGGGGENYAVDDFVVDDEMEDEDRASRLQNVKERGADQYKGRTQRESESEEDVAVDEEEEEEEAQFTDEEERVEKQEDGPQQGRSADNAESENTGAPRSKRRRVVADSDEE